MTRANLVGVAVIVAAMVFGATPVSAQHRHVAGRGQFSGHINAGAMHAGRYAVPRVYHRPGVPVPAYAWARRYDRPLATFGHTRYRALFPLYRYGYPFYGGYGYPFYGYPYTYGYSIPLAGYGSYGGVRLEIPQDDAEVYVDRSYAGTVDDFDGHWQELQLEPGQHQIEVRAPGYEPLTFTVNIQQGRNIVYHQTLQPIHR